MTTSPQQPGQKCPNGHKAYDVLSTPYRCIEAGCKYCIPAAEDTVDAILYQFRLGIAEVGEKYFDRPQSGTKKIYVELKTKQAKANTAIRQLIDQARITVLTELDNSADEVTSEVFDRFYMAEVDRFKSAQGKE